MDELLDALKAAGEPTRLRLLAVLAESELTVTELCHVLGQSQPRVSRHLRLLCEAGLLDRHSQGTSAYYRPSRNGTGRRLFDAVLPLVDSSDPAVSRDMSRLAEIRAERAKAAGEYFERIAGDWDQMRDLHVADADVEAAMLSALDDVFVSRAQPDGRFGDLLDVGTGTGRILELFADRIDRGVGIDLSRQMLNLARSRLDELGLRHCSVRHGSVYDLDIDTASFDVAVLHHVLHFLDEPATAVREAAWTLRPGGQLVIVDFAPHSHERVREDYAHHWLGFADDDVSAWCLAAGLENVRVTHLSHTWDDLSAEKARDQLTVTLWIATQRADAPAVYGLEAAS